jgi:MFS family permease
MTDARHTGGEGHDAAAPPKLAVWRQPDFRRLWGGQTLSLFGSEVTEFVLPMVAILTLSATTSQVGILRGAQFAPFLLLSLFAGVLVDRVRRRRVMIASNASRAVLIGLVPLAAALGVLTAEPLYVIAFLFGVATLMFDTAYLSYLPSLLERTELVQGNSRLAMSASTAEASGPGLGGLLVQAFTAPAALAVNAIGYAASALSLTRIKRPEPVPEAAEPFSLRAVGREIRDGLRIVLGSRYLRPLVGEAATFNFFEQVFLVVFLVHAVRVLDIGPGLLGLVIAVGALGALTGASTAPLAARRAGLGRALLVSMAIGNAAPLLVLLVTDDSALGIATLFVAFLLKGYGVGLSNVHTITLRQTVTPHGMLGRMNASYRVVSYGGLPLGALIGGILGEVIGQRPTIAIGVVGLCTATLWVAFSPIRSLRSVDEVSA